MKWNKLRLVWSGAVIVALSIGGIFLFQKIWLGPNVLIIHAPRQRWQCLSVVGGPQYGMSPQTIMVMVPPRQEFRLSPFLSGQHELWVTFADKKVLKAKFSLSNIKAFRQMDIYIDRIPGRNRAFLREVVNEHRTIFSGDVHVGEAILGK